MKTDKVFVSFKFAIAIFFFLLPISSSFTQDVIDLDMLSAREEFKWGVKAYHRGLFNESARAFEKALAYKPENTEMQEWLGLAWFRSGFTDASIHLWESIQAAGEADSLLMNRLEILQQQTGVLAGVPEAGRYLPAMELEGVQEDFTLFRRPASIYPDDNGGFYLVSYGTNEVLGFNSNGALTNRINGGLEGFNHPFDIELAGNDRFYVTEFNGDRISSMTVDGRDIIKFGESGRRDGQLLGPQYISSDEKNFIYVTDSGNRRVVKFDEAGNFILSFGRKNYNFSGLENPTGIVSFDGRVYIADADRGDISIFDYSGNYIASMASEGLYAPEGISRLGERTLLIADSGRVMSFDADTGVLRLVSDIDGKGRRITKAAIDSNGNLLTVDFDLSRVTVLTELANMYSGLFLQIDRVDSSNYPEVIVDLRIMDRTGKPFVGLASNNFVVTENGYPVPDAELDYRGNTDEHIEAAVLLDCRAEMEGYHPDIIKAVNSLMNSAAGLAGLRLTTAGVNPVTDALLAEGSRQFIAAASNPAIFSEDSRFDLGLRHAASELMNWRGRRSIIYITNGQNGDLAFEQYHPVELAAYLKNNGISFYCVNVSNDNPVSEELNYICEETGGGELYLYQPEGLSMLYRNIIEKPDGTYTLTFNSINTQLTADDFISLEVEAFLYNRSGRESTGYFQPGKF
ncbi:MAG: hypothetical protein PQJ61_00795 [Spirochaetales bacterium]|uniref:Uncharacterized protein n=1 Tax=Candidatus Thalassospirochaeta sargassi TaxID=3119039 RepID=A0AAJ1ID68_9SPIO|nr:hypothetical protein [Spirochaetales bacterium]